jgi:hypothetical protein
VVTNAFNGEYSAGDIAYGVLYGGADGLVAGASDGFSNIRHAKTTADAWLNAADTATSGVATGALLTAGGSAVLAPVTGGSSLTVTAGAVVVAGVAGVVNVGVQVAKDVAKVIDHRNEGGIVTAFLNKADADRKAGIERHDWRAIQQQHALDQQAARAKAWVPEPGLNDAFKGRGWAMHAAVELANVAKELCNPKLGWGKHIGNGDATVTADEIRATMKQYNITLSEVDAFNGQHKGDGHIERGEMARTLKAHHVDAHSPRSGGQGR